MNIFSKSKGITDEVPRYLVVIGVTFICDAAVLYLLTTRTHASQTGSVLLAYASGVLVNYMLSTHWVFGTRRFKGIKELSLFLLIAVFGALLSVVGVRYFTRFGYNIVITKVLTEAVVGAIILTTKKVFLFSDYLKTLDAMNVFKDLPLGARAHILIRWLTVPYARVKAVIPKDALTLLELGSGHGLFTTLLRRDLKLKKSVGQEIDKDKLIIARKAHGAAEFTEQVDSKELFDVVLIVDVLYVMNNQEQIRFVEHAITHVKPKGTLVIKEMSNQPAWKYAWAKFQEFMSVKLFKITDHKGDAVINMPDLELIKNRLVEAGFDAHIKRIDAGYIHPHAVLVGTKL